MQLVHVPRLRVVPCKGSGSAPQVVRQIRPLLRRLQLLQKLPRVEDGTRSLVGCGHIKRSNAARPFGVLGNRVISVVKKIVARMSVAYEKLKCGEAHTRQALNALSGR